MKYLFDTNIIIYYLQKMLPPSARSFVNGIFNEERPCFSVITEIELLCWKAATEQDLMVLRSFIADSAVVDLNPAIKEMTAQIRRAHGAKLADAIIAATALNQSRILLTRNTADFKSIEGLKMINVCD